MVCFLITSTVLSSSNTLIAMDKERALGIIVIAVAAIYGLSSVDLAPELVLGPVGLVDDAAVIAAAVGIAVKLFSSSKNTHGQAD